MHCNHRSMNTSKSRILAMLTILSAVSFGACSSESGQPLKEGIPEGSPSRPPTPSQNQEVLDYITNLSPLVLPDESHTESSTSQDEVRNIPATVNVCTYTEISETSHFDKLVSFDPNAD